MSDEFLDAISAPTEPWWIDAAELLSRPDPGPTPFLVENLIVDRAITAGVGRWKTTKSYGTLDICISVATGLPAFGVLAIPEPGPVVFVNEESGEAALWRRLDALCRGRAVDPEKLRGRLLLAANAGVKLDDPNWHDRLIELGEQVKPKVFVFDPLARMKAPERNESAQNEISLAIEFMRRLRDATEAGVFFIHHTGHQGETMRGSSDLETVWESRLHWSRDGQSPEIKITSEHREAEASPPFKYRISWHGLTRTMRFEPVDDPAAERVKKYAIDHPELSKNRIYDDLKSKGTTPRKTTVIRLIDEVREGGSQDAEPPWNHPSRSVVGGGSPDPLSEGSGTTPPDPPFHPVPDSRNHRWPNDSFCQVCDAGKRARTAAGVIYLECGHMFVEDVA